MVEKAGIYSLLDVYICVIQKNVLSLHPNCGFTNWAAKTGHIVNGTAKVTDGVNRITTG
jgi:hypothetical protein